MVISFDSVEYENGRIVLKSTDRYSQKEVVAILRGDFRALEAALASGSAHQFADAKE